MILFIEKQLGLKMRIRAKLVRQDIRELCPGLNLNALDELP